MYRSNVMTIDELIDTFDALVSGATPLTTGGPTVVNVNSPLPSWPLPERSSTPGAMWTWNVEERGSLFEGGKIMVVPPCQWNEPPTFGVIENAAWAPSCFTSSLKLNLPEGRTSARQVPN